MFEDTAYGTSQAGGLRAGAKAAGIEIVMDEGYPLGITDVTPLINKLRASNAQAVFPVSYLNDSLQIVRGMRQQKLEIPTIGGAAGYIIPTSRRALAHSRKTSCRFLRQLTILHLNSRNASASVSATSWCMKPWNSRQRWMSSPRRLR